jgi:hypothetical protein
MSEQLGGAPLVLTLLGMFCIAVVSFCCGTWALLALVRWLAAGRARWVPEHHRWQRLWYRLDAGRCLRLPAFWGGLLAVLTMCVLFLYVRGYAGCWTALSLSLLAGWSNPDDLWRYVLGAMLGIASVLLWAGLLIDLSNAFKGLAMAPLIMVFVVPVGASLFMAGAVLRQMIDPD